MTLQEQVIALVNLRVVRVADLQPRRATAEQPIRTLRELPYNTFAIALAHRAEEIDAAPDDMVSAEHDCAARRGSRSARPWGRWLQTQKLSSDPKPPALAERLA